MLKRFGALVITTSMALPMMAQAAAPSTPEAKTGYAIGVVTAKQLQQSGIDSLDVDSYSQAIRDVLSNQDLQMSQDEIQNTLKQFQQEMMAKAQAEQQQQAADNKAKGDAFLADNADKDGVKVTDSGLQYKVIRKGDGETPEASDTVKVNYEGKLLDGTVFDSSYQRGEPVSFQVNQVIPGWQEALQLMPVGSEYELYIPANLAYGPAGAGGKIGPNETLHFKVELLSIEDGQDAQADAQ